VTQLFFFLASKLPKETENTVYIHKYFRQLKDIVAIGDKILKLMKGLRNELYLNI